MSSFIALNPEFTDEVRASFARQEFMRYLGATIERVEPGAVDIAMPYRPELVQQNGYVHAGAITSIADSASGYAAYTLMPAGSSVLSVEFKVNLLAPAEGDRFLAEGRVIRAGKTLTVTRGDVYAYRGEERKHIATMQATMIRLEKPLTQ
ncbi:MAG: PaaI family thioesterase [Pyrinomonadaceae bacterium]